MSKVLAPLPLGQAMHKVMIRAKYEQAVMATEYFIDGEDKPAIWQSLMDLIQETPDFAGVCYNGFCLKFSASSDWHYDIRLFGPDPIMIEISSWADDVRTEFCSILTKLRKTHPIRIADEDGAPSDL
ncbi:hypothetical protein [Halovulum sp. GXIMD14793]